MKKLKTFEDEKKEFLSLLNKIRSILIGEKQIDWIKIQDFKQGSEPYGTYVDGWIKTNFQEPEVMAKLIDLGCRIEKDSIFVKFNNCECHFPAANIDVIIDFTKNEKIPVNFSQGTDYEFKSRPFRTSLPKLNDFDNYIPYENTPIAHKETLAIAEDNYKTALNEVETISKLIREAVLGDTKKLALHLKGAQDRVLIFKNQLVGARREYLYARDEYAREKIKELVNIDFGGENLKLESDLKKQLQEIRENLKDTPLKSKWRSKTAQTNIEKDYELKQSIEDKISVLDTIKEKFEDKHNTPENMNKFADEFINVEIN